MDRTGIDLDSTADLFGKTTGTIRNWRSAGVPSSQQDWAARVMTEWEGKQSQQLPDRLTLEPTPEEFDDWNRAALRAGKIVREWALEALSEAANEKPTGPTLYNDRAVPTGLVREDAPDEEA